MFNVKNWPYWVRGAFIVLILYIIALVLVRGMDFSSGFLLGIFLLAPTFILDNILQAIASPEISSSFSDPDSFVSYLVSPLFYILVGALLGWIYGVIKRRDR
jgi:ribose/xylose/arabinose/galactoside ABC-type transport system permease subunit